MRALHLFAVLTSDIAEQIDDLAAVAPSFGVERARTVALYRAVQRSHLVEHPRVARRQIQAGSDCRLHQADSALRLLDQLVERCGTTPLYASDDPVEALDVLLGHASALLRL